MCYARCLMSCKIASMLFQLGQAQSQDYLFIFFDLCCCGCWWFFFLLLFLFCFFVLFFFCLCFCFLFCFVLFLFVFCFVSFCFFDLVFLLKGSTGPEGPLGPFFKKPTPHPYHLWRTNNQTNKNRKKIMAKSEPFGRFAITHHLCLVSKKSL